MSSDPHQILVRRAVKDDWGAIRRLARITRSHLETGDPWLAKAAAGRLLVAEFDSAGVVGYAVALGWAGPTIHLADSPDRRMEDPEYWFIHDVAVDPEFRRRSVGARLLDRCVAEGERRGLSDIHAVAGDAVIAGWLATAG